LSLSAAGLLAKCPALTLCLHNKYLVRLGRFYYYRFINQLFTRS